MLSFQKCNDACFEVVERVSEINKSGSEPGSGSVKTDHQAVSPCHLLFSAQAQGCFLSCQVPSRIFSERKESTQVCSQMQCVCACVCVCVCVCACAHACSCPPGGTGAFCRQQPALPTPWRSGTTNRPLFPVPSCLLQSSHWVSTGGFFEMLLCKSTLAKDFGGFECKKKS